MPAEPTLFNLTCPNCGAALQVTSDMERFACSHCGKQIIVQRTGGAITLKLVLEKLDILHATAQRIESATQTQSTATANVARELNIARLRQEITALKLQKQLKQPELQQYSTALFVCLLLAFSALLVGTTFSTLLVDGRLTMGCLFISGLLALVFYFAVRSIVSPLNRQIANKQNEINRLLYPRLTPSTQTTAPPLLSPIKPKVPSKNTSGLTTKQWLVVGVFAVAVSSIFCIVCSALAYTSRSNSSARVNTVPTRATMENAVVLLSPTAPLPQPPTQTLAPATYLPTWTPTPPRALASPTRATQGLTYLEIVTTYDHMTDIQRETYRKQLIGKKVHWSGTVVDVAEDGIIQIDAGGDFFQAVSYIVMLEGMKPVQAAKLSKKQKLEFDATIKNVQEYIAVHIELQLTKLY